MADSNVLGLETATTVAGFLGALASLSAIKPLTRAQAMLAVFTGAATAGYLNPMVMHYCGIDAEPVKNGMGFLIGVSAMHIIPGFLYLAEQFRKNPLSAIRRILGSKDNLP